MVVELLVVGPDEHVRTEQDGTTLGSLLSVQDPQDGMLARQSVVAIQLVNEALAGVFAEAGIPVAAVAAAFAMDDRDTLVPMAGHGQVPRNLALLCERSWMCLPPPLGPDRHPNVLGAQVMADAFAGEFGSGTERAD